MDHTYEGISVSIHFMILNLGKRRLHVPFSVLDVNAVVLFSTVLIPYDFFHSIVYNTVSTSKV